MIYRLVSAHLDQLPDDEIEVLAVCKSFSFVQSSGANGAREAMTADLMTAVQDELNLTATRLLTRGHDVVGGGGEGARQLFDIYSRLQAEAEFRVAVAVPTSALLGVVLAELLPDALAIALAISAFTVLITQAVSKKRDAGDRVVDALLIGVVDAPVLTGISAGSYTRDALNEGQLRPLTRDASPELLLSRMVGIPWTKRARFAISEPIVLLLDLVSDGCSAGLRVLTRLASPVVWGTVTLRRGALHVGHALREHVWRRLTALPGAIKFAILDHAATGGAARRRIRELKRLALPHDEEAMRVAATLREYGYYQEAIASYPDSPKGIASLADTQFEALDAALACTNGRALSEFMVARIDEGRVHSAERVCRRAVNAGLPVARVLLGDVLANSGRLAEAGAQYRGAARRGVVHGLTKLGDLRQRLGDSEGARSAFAEAARRGDALADERLASLTETNDAAVA